MFSGRVAHTGAGCRAKTHLNGGPPKSAPKGKGVGSCEEEEQETSQNVPLGTIDLGSFEVLSHHGDTVEDDVFVDESSEEATGTKPPLPPAPWLKKSSTSKHTEMHRGRFSKHFHDNGCRDGEESSFFDSWDEQPDTSQGADPSTQKKRLPFRKLPCLHCVSKVGCVQPTVANYSSQFDISSEGESLPDEIKEEAAAIDNSNDEEWWLDEVDLNTVTISNMCIDSKPVETDGRRGRHREITVDSGAGESVVNPDEWPNADLKPSTGSVKGQRHVGPGGEKIDDSR